MKIALNGNRLVVNTSKKLLTIVICTRDRAEKLEITLAAVIDQMTRSRFSPSILIIDSSSTSKTKQVVNSLRKTHKKFLDLRYVHKVMNGTSLARNVAIRETKTELLCFIDDDIVPQKTWLTSARDFIIKKSSADVVFGPIYPVPEDGTSSPKLEKITRFSPWVFVANTGKNVRPCPYTANVIIRLAAFQKIGMFNTVFANMDKEHFHPFGEDSEWFLRAEEHGLETKYLPKMAVNHRIDLKRLNIFYLAWRYYDDGKNGVLFQFYSKYYIHSPWSILRPEFFMIKKLLSASKNEIILSIVYACAELAGQMVMRCTLLLDFEYYNGHRQTP